MVRTRRALKKSFSKKRQIVLLSRFGWVVRNQQGLCWYCNEFMGINATKEHLHPQALGGTDSYPIGNLKAACSPCNHAVSHLEVHQKYLLKEICSQMGKREMYIAARKMVRASLRETFLRLDKRDRKFKNGN